MPYRPMRHPPETVAQARLLFEGSHMTLREIGGRVGIGYWHVFTLAHRLGWARPPRKRRRKGTPVHLPAFPGDRARQAPCPGPVSPPLRRKTGKGHAFGPGVVGEVRDLVRTTLLTQREIARRVGVSQGCVHRYIAKYGWARPAGAPVATDAVGLPRAGHHLRLRALHLRILALAERAVAESRPPPACGGEGRADAQHPAGAGGGAANSPGDEKAAAPPARLAPDGTSPPSPPQAGGGFSAALSLRDDAKAACGRRGLPEPALARRDAQGPLREVERWSPVIRLRLVAPREGRSGRPYPDGKVEEARELFETSRLTIRQIAASISVAPTTLCRWRRNGGWARPPGAPRPADLAPSRRAIIWHAARMRPFQFAELAEEIVAGLEAAEGPPQLAVLRSALDLAREAAKPMRRPEKAGRRWARTDRSG